MEIENQKPTKEFITNIVIDLLIKGFKQSEIKNNLFENYKIDVTYPTLSRYIKFGKEFIQNYNLEERQFMLKLANLRLEYILKESFESKDLKNALQTQKEIIELNRLNYDNELIQKLENLKELLEKE